MKRWLFIASYMLLTAALASFLDAPSVAILSRNHAVIFAVVIVASWVLVLWRLFRSTAMSRREKAVAWLCAIALFCGLLSIRRVWFYLYHPSFLTLLEWHGIWLLLALMFMVIARLVSGKYALPTSTPCTVESEAPDHVITVASVPNYSFNATVKSRGGNPAPGAAR